MVSKPSSVLDHARQPRNTFPGSLAAMWIWTGVSYHGLFFAPINPLALAFGALFVVQGILFVNKGVRL